ncbi:hypothetical protein BDY19DRAFT_566029 [Irpex rosettiformis]|uniref:Uncharacterized protein n=1 Tax=Irpex rosettiformis TaxID=378272 RepID=A0ACB8UD67_9APHY|nr:hypothetical protein BDY19DRAFT_566029 [Irpex rosettiformis]
MSSLGDLADLLAIGAQAQQGSQAINYLGSLGLGGDDNGINIPGLSLPTVQGGSAATSTQASRTAQTSATQVSNTSSTGSSQSISSSSTSTSSISATTTSSSGSPSSSAASTLETSSATDSASASSPTGSSTTDTPRTVTASLTSGVSDSLGPTPTGNAKAADTVPTGFLAHKPLYIGIIVVASILGIIFFVVVGTWALRRRRRGKIADFAEELSSDNLVGAGSGFGGGSSGSSLGHGSDVEKGVTVAGGWGVDVIEKMEAVGGSRGEGAPLGAMARVRFTAT